MCVDHLTQHEIPEDSKSCETLNSRSFVSMSECVELSVFLARFACYVYGPVLLNFVLIGGICSGSSFIAIKKNNQLGFLWVLNN